MNVRIIILNGACLLSAVPLVGCATPTKLQQAFSRNTGDDIGQTRITRKEKLAQDFDHTRDDAQFDAAASSWERGDLEGCRRILEQLLDRNPNHPRARLMLADWYLFNGQAERSAEELNKALAIDPKNAMAHHSLAQVLEACGRRDEAMAQYRLATELEPNNQVYAQSCKMAIDLAPTAPPRELLAAQNSNLEDLKKSDIPDGSTRPGRTMQLASATTAPPAAQVPAKNGSELNHDRLFAGGQVDDWLKPIDASFPSEPRDRPREFAKSPVTIAAGNVSNTGGNAVANPSQVQLASWNAPDGTSLRPVEPTVKLASRPAQTADSLATATNPQIRQTPLREAVVALAQGDTAAAIAAAQRGLAETPAQSAALYRVLGAAHYRLGEYQTAQAELAQALSLDNHDALAYFLMSATLEKLNDHQSAERFRAEAVRLDGRFGS